MRNYSQAYQDLFVLECLNNKRNGTFLDLGCNDPILISNTYLLEIEYGWNGIGVDIEQSLIDKYHSVRRCKTVCADCTKLDFEGLLKDYTNIDYLSLDIDPMTLTCLAALPLHKKKFAVVTYEHDFYSVGEPYRKQSREIFKAHGYHMVCSDVMGHGLPYEDWYIHPDLVDVASVAHLQCADQECSDIVKRFIHLAAN